MTTQRPTAELIAELRLNSQLELTADIGLMWIAADRLQSILTAWEAWLDNDGPVAVDEANFLALRLAITGTSAEVRE